MPAILMREFEDRKSELSSLFAVAPMAGARDTAFRRPSAARRALVVTEMVSSEGPCAASIARSSSAEHTEEEPGLDQILAAIPRRWLTRKSSRPAGYVITWLPGARSLSTTRAAAMREPETRR